MSSGVRTVWRSMPLRLALLLVILFTTVSLLSLAASYVVTRNAFEEAIRDDLAQDMAGFRAAPSSVAVALLVQAESQETDPGRLVLSYVSASGQVYGNGAIAKDGEGFQIVSLREGQSEFDGAYLALSTELYGGRLTIARSRAEIEALQPVFLNILLVSLLPTALVALGGGLILARRSKRHVEVIRATLDKLTTGNLAARVRVGPRWSDDLSRIGETVNAMAGAQEHSVTALRQVSSDIAHDLKTPVQRVSLTLDALSRQTPPGKPAALLDEAQEELRGIAATFASLLELAQAENSALRADFRPVDLAALCQTLADVHEPVAGERGQTLHCEASRPAVVMGERNLLGQLVSNLLANALRHTPENSDIRISVKAQDGAVVLVVCDNGPGIPSDERDKVLQRLYRLDRSRSTPGNGLGLSLVDAVARLHGARISLEDAGPGLQVRVSFDAAPDGS
ncbi:HAMP domain-containing sensor histidine kinase [Sulfitobacter sp. S190]|uniref:sensor histidine kinase n=1 Tax=Sulfitobacter sp. S190 TaxID=2867022 RepID=UPI0021A8D00D|nr:HAMP domain-containing sensor histidine kinase [Sulfitobacter sp. S190]UWR23050.1 HAMP domain-containing histidine kinase [Sulfitobacter sp. S190]